MLGNIVVSGAGSLLRGFTDRLVQELGLTYPSPKIKAHAPGNLYERRFASWIGGSILASLGTFHQVCHGFSQSILCFCLLSILLDVDLEEGI